MDYRESNERLGFRNKEDYSELEDIIKDMLGSRLSGFRMIDKYGDVLSSFFMKAFGLRIIVIPSEKKYAEIQCTFLNKRHVLASKYIRKTLDRQNIPHKTSDVTLSKMALGEKGNVDGDALMVSGAFSKLENTLYIGLKRMRKKGLTASEMTAVVLHEVGHAFTMIQYADRSFSTNEMLYMLSSEAKYDRKKYDYILNKGVREGVLSKDDKNDVMETESKYILTYKLSKTLFDKMNSELPDAGYDDVSGERMADMFASRCGYSIELTRALHKLGKKHTKRSSIIYKTYIAIMLTMLGAMLIYLGSLYLPIVIVTMYLVKMIIEGLTYLLSDKKIDESGNKHDVLKRRITAVKNDLLQRVKSKDLTNGEIKRILFDIDSMEKLLENIDDGPGVIRRFFDNMNYDTKKYQQELEDLASNPLLLASLKLKTIRN